VCGICGVFYFDRGRVVSRSVLEDMNHQIVHRGPDEAGFYSSESIGMAMRRLSIIDVAGGQQPVTNEDGSIWLVFNGEIYNHMELRATLERLGHRYQSHCDTETIVHAYEEFGPDCVKHLRGMFAIAIWDSRRRRLFLARDRLGIKPLYFLYGNEQILFASEIKSLLAFPGVRAAFNRDALPEYLAFGYLSGSRTMFCDVQKLLPGQTAEISDTGQLQLGKYWELPRKELDDARPRKFYVQTYREMLEDTVSSHLMSDVPLGMFLSGGLDSSAVAALMSKVRKDPIETFAVGYDEEAYSELPYARMVANHIGSRHHEVRVSRSDFFAVLPKLIWHEDEPLVWPSSVSLYFVAKLASERVKVVLTGEGSDETLAGYGRYTWTMLNSRFDRIYRGLVPSGVRKIIREQINASGRLSANARRRLEHTFLGRDGASWASLYYDNFYSAFSEADQAALLSKSFEIDPGSAYRDVLAYWEKSQGDLLDRLLCTDIKTYLVELCMKQDQMSMAASIESRVPFLDHRLVEFAISIPAKYEIRGREGKLILKEAVQDLLPDAIIHRKKMGFPTPLSSWLLGPQLDTVEELLLSPRSLERGLFRPERVRQIFIEHRTNHRDHADRIWRLLNFEIWQRVFIDRDLAPMTSVLRPVSEVTDSH
jgi:asparagine synthase (glutamine-hydrolysing)